MYGDKSPSDQIETLRKVILDMNKSMISSFHTIDTNFSAIELKLELLEKKIDSLTDTSSKEFEMVGGKLTEVKDELMKIQKVSNYSEEFENLLKVSR